MKDTVSAAPRANSRIGLIVLAYVAFISLGLPDGLLGVAWPSLRADFKQPLDSLGYLLFAGMIGYLTSSFFGGKIMARLGLGKLLAASCALTGAGLIGYTLAPNWWVMVALGVVAGLGGGAIDTGINTYVASEHSAGLMQWLHASFGIGVTLGPVIMTAGLNLLDSWRVGYVVVGCAQLALAAGFAVTASRWERPAAPDADDSARRLMDYKTPLTETLRQPAVWLSVLCFFVYTGFELSLGHWNYTLLTSRGIAPAAAGLWAGSYWASFTLGRGLAGVYTRRVGLNTLLRGSMLTALLGVLLIWWNPSGGVSLLGVALTGFAIAPIYPGMVSGTGQRVGAKHAANTIGIQNSAAGLGGAMIPALAGVLARRIALEAIPVYLVGVIFTLIVLYTLATWYGRRNPA